MPAYREMPDVEGIVGKWLRDGNIPGIATRWYSSVPKTPEFPIGTYQRVSGVPPVRQYLDAANIQIDVWGTSKSGAHDIIQKARVRVHEMSGQTFVDPVPAFVTGVDDSLGVVWDPDELTGRDRYLFSVIVYARSMG